MFVFFDDFNVEIIKNKYYHLIGGKLYDSQREEAAVYLEKAAKMDKKFGDVIGYMYMTGDGVKKDEKKGMKYLKDAGKITKHTQQIIEAKKKELKKDGKTFYDLHNTIGEDSTKLYNKFVNERLLKKQQLKKK